MIYDCFPFFNELDIIEIRFKELYNVVDRFVVAESQLTHSGQPKPLYFYENKARFAPFMDKIIHVVADDPIREEEGWDMNWTRERNQRNAMYRVLQPRCQDDDIIITTDADEIYDANMIEQLKQIGDGFTSLEMRSSWYYLNMICEPRWIQGKALRFKSLRDKFNGNLSKVRVSGVEDVINNCGWHMSYMGGYEKVKQKLQSFAHQEFNKPEIINDQHIALVVRFGSAAWDDFKDTNPRGNDPYWKYVKIEDFSFPRALKEGGYKHLCSEAGYSRYAYDCGNLYHIFDLAKTLNGTGAVIDLGCFEGRVSSYLANALPDKQVTCVDKVISDQLSKNMNHLTDGNYVSVESESIPFIAGLSQTIKVLHVNDSYDYEQTKDLLATALPKLEASHLICGYNWEEEGTRHAVTEVLGEVSVSGKLWYRLR